MIVAFDTETHLFRPGLMAPPVVCLSWALDEDQAGLMLRKEAGPWLQERLGKETLVGHNVAYDSACLLSSLPEIGPALWQAYDAGMIQCTRARERLLDIADGTLGVEEGEGKWSRKSYALDELAKWLGFTMDKGDEGPRATYGRLDGVPIEKWTERERNYPVVDALVTRALFERQATRAKATHYGAFEIEAARQARYDLALRLTSCWGLAVDQARVRELDVRLTARKAELDVVLLAAGILSGKGSVTTKVVRELIEAHWDGGEIPRTPKTKQIQTSAEVLEACDHPALQALAERAAVGKIKSTYVDKLVEAGANPVHPSYDVLVTTGRTSSRGPNIQNQPRKHSVRECFKAREGWILISCDYDSQELRTLAQVLKVITGRSTLADRYGADPHYDPHVDLCVGRMGIDYAEGLRRKKAGDPELKRWRQRQKISNFGYPGGMGAKTYRIYARGYGLSLTEQEAMDDRENWFRQLPEMRIYFGHIDAVTSSGSGTIEHLYSGRLRGMCGFSDSANSYFQGLAADASKTALYEVVRRCYGDPTSPLFGSRPAAFLHDEILLEAPEDRAHEAAEELAKVMCEAMEQWTPDVPAAASPALMRHWSKEAEEVRDQDGRLIPWEDREGRAA